MTEPVNDPPADGLAASDLMDAVTLPCGAEVDSLLEQVADGHAGDLDAHQLDCVHCRAAIAEFAELWAPVAEKAVTPVPAPPGLAAAVMRQIRALVSDVWYTLQATDLGTIRIAARIVATVARDSARMVPGVRVALGRSTHGKVAALMCELTHFPERELFHEVAKYQVQSVWVTHYPDHLVRREAEIKQIAKEEKFRGAVHLMHDRVAHDI